jgi:hypothetical protein
MTTIRGIRPGPRPGLPRPENGLTPGGVGAIGTHRAAGCSAAAVLVWRRSSAVEQGNHNPLVGGSNPSAATRKNQTKALLYGVEAPTKLPFGGGRCRRFRIYLGLLAVGLCAGLSSSRDVMNHPITPSTDTPDSEPAATVWPAMPRKKA